MRTNQITLSTICLLITASLSLSQNQKNASMDVELSLLRGSWQYHTYDDKFTLTFQSDSDLLVGGEPAKYVLFPGSLRIASDDTEIDYTYVIKDNYLTLISPKGDKTKYERDGDGRAETLVNGLFYNFNDSTKLEQSLSFEQHAKVEAILMSQSTDRRVGYYRIEGKEILIIWEDGSTDEAWIRSRSEDGSSISIVYSGELFKKELPLEERQVPITAIAVPPPIYYPTPAPLPPPCPSPVPPIVTGPVQPHPATVTETPKPLKTTVRDFGSTRGAKP